MTLVKQMSFLIILFPIINIGEKIEFELGKPNKKNSEIIFKSIKNPLIFCQTKKHLDC